MNNAQNEDEINDVFLYMMHIAFIEIRASESLNASKKFADIFHQLPMQLKSNATNKDGDAIFEKLLERARRYDMVDYIKKLKIQADKII